MSEFNPLDPFADAITEVANKTYDDTLHPVLQETGKSLALIPRAINAALAALQIWTINREYKIEETTKLLEIKLANISPEKIIPPEPYVAVPAIQAISYCMNCEELRDMFASLLASAMNSDKKDDVHPSFVEIIKNLSPLDAKIINFLNLKNNDKIPIVNYQFSKIQRTSFLQLEAGKQVTDILNHVILIDDIETNVLKTSTSIHNLERLGLISINYTSSISDSHLYDKFEKTDLYNEYRSSKSLNPNLEDFEIEIVKGILKPTPYGMLFSEITA